MAPQLSIPPEEVQHPPVNDEHYVAWRAATDLRAPYRVAPEFLRGTKKDALYDTDEAPLIVFINARSGGRVGPELAGVLSRALGSSQVFDVSEHRPDKVLRQIWSNLEQQQQRGNPHAAAVIAQLQLQPQPAVAIMPLGTGNDLSRSFKWGTEFDWSWIKGHASVYSTLKRVADAPTTNLDFWQLRLLLPDGSYKPAHTYAIEEAAGAASQQQQQQQGIAGLTGSSCSSSVPVVMQGMFWNYFSIGADAQAAYNFHHLRDQHPMLAPNRVANQFWYSAFSCTSGWFCGAVPSVSNFAGLQVLQPRSSEWQQLAIPAGIKALVLVNLQSYGGGRNIWGESESRRRSWRTPDVADGLIEVVGFTHGYHAVTVMASGAKLARGRRIAQVSGVRLALHSPAAQPDGARVKLFMQLDGEPWEQQVPAGSSQECVVLEVVHAGTSRLLANRTEPCSHPEKKMTKMLNKQQAAAYLAAPADDGNDSSIQSDAKQQKTVQLSDVRDPRQLQLLQEPDECYSSSLASSAYAQQAAAPSSSLHHHQRQSGAFPLVPQRVRAVSYGGALPNAHTHELPAGSSCSDPGIAPSHGAAASSHTASGRRSLAVQTGAAGSDGAACYTEGDSSEYDCQASSSLSSPAGLLAGRQYSYSSGGSPPAAVAVIEMVGGQPALAMEQLEGGAVKVPHATSAVGAAGAAAGVVDGRMDGRARGFSALEDLRMC
ncbi:diacylglycerol kinase accessory domain-containing protein [Scenedesmus sp. NREL 46B-D3]|nr:diacylglycerol kinase accessory domain-containing protein [Scenedesmus sp. NREL 46B-D3]